MITIRDAIAEDAGRLAALWSRYLHEHYAMERVVDAATILRDGIGPERRIRFAVAEHAVHGMCGAVAWAPGFDLHHFVRGVDVLDLYVPPEHRGRAVAVQLLAHVARLGECDGAQYMRGAAALEPTPGRRLYDRCVVYFEGKTANLSARAFRHLASLAGASAREICRNLPQHEDNFRA